MTHPLLLKLDQSGLLTSADREVLLSLCSPVRQVAVNRDIVREGSPAENVHLVIEGMAGRYKLLLEGKRQIIGLLIPGDFCDLQSAVLGAMDHAIAALTPCSIVDISQRTIDELTLNHSRIARAFWWATLADESVLREWLVNMGQRPANTRTAHLLSELLLRLQVVGRATQTGCDLPLTQTELGDILGLTNVHINRVLQDLRRRGLVIYKERRLEVPDVAALHAFCGFKPDYLHLHRTLLRRV